MSRNVVKVVVAALAMSVACEAGVLLASDAPGTTPPATRPVKDKQMHEALHLLKQARSALFLARHDVNQDREKVEEQVDYAIEQVYAALETDAATVAQEKAKEAAEMKKDKEALAKGEQTHHQFGKALKHLEGAKAALEAAPAEYKGHRTKAIEFTNQAIEEAKAITNPKK